MGSERESDVGTQRRTVLKLLSVAAGAGTLSAVGAGQVDEGEFAVVQDDRCIPVTPFSGDQPVEELYDWRAADTGYSSAGTTDLQRDDTSILFLYDGPNGTSLVLVHGHYRGDEDEGGSVSMAFEGLPEGGEWVVEDDRYDGDSNFDRWNHDGSRSEIDWTVRYNRTDGGAFRGLGDDASISIEPAFNEESHFGDQYYTSTITDWQVLSGDRDDPERVSLDMEQSITVRAGGCDATENVDGVDDTEDEETGDDGGSGGGEDDEESTDDRTAVVVDQDTDGNVETDGSVLVKASVEVDGNVEAGRDVVIEDGGAIDGNVEAGGTVDVGSESEVDGNVEAGGDVDVGPAGEVDGNVEASDAVIVRSDSEIGGNVTGASVDIADSAEVDGRGDDDDSDDDDADSDERSEDDDDADDDDDDDRRRTKHEKRQRKHEKKHEKQQRKHEKQRKKEQKKHEKRQRKHEKRRKKQRKKPEKRQKKHEKKGRKHDRDDSTGLGDVLGAVDDALGGDD